MVKPLKPYYRSLGRLKLPNPEDNPKHVICYRLSKEVFYSIPTWAQPICSSLGNLYGVKILWKNDMVPGYVNIIKTFFIYGHPDRIKDTVKAIIYIITKIEKFLFKLSQDNRRLIANDKKRKKPKGIMPTKRFLAMHISNIQMKSKFIIDSLLEDNPDNNREHRNWYILEYIKETMPLHTYDPKPIYGNNRLIN